MEKKAQLQKVFPVTLAFAAVFAAGMLFDQLMPVAVGKGHQAAHGGVLNVIGEEVGHAEIRLNDGMAEIWLVGGGNDTHRAVPIKAGNITLTIQKELVFDASPLVLAGESAGECSHFVARAEWLGPMQEFTAHGHLLLKGQEHDLLIRYPGGYDPHHGEDHAHNEDEH